MKTEIRSFFDAVRPAIDAALEELLPSEHTSPSELHRAMRYSVMAGGKRLRPALCVAAYGIYHGDYRPILVRRRGQGACRAAPICRRYLASEVRVSVASVDAVRPGLLEEDPFDWIVCRVLGMAQSVGRLNRKAPLLRVPERLY